MPEDYMITNQNGNTAVCICIKLGAIIPTGDSGNIKLKLTTVLEEAKKYSVSLQFCLTAYEMSTYPELVTLLNQMNHKVDIALEETSDNQDIYNVERALIEAENAFQNSSTSWWGVYSPAALNDPGLLDLCMDFGVRWVAFKNPIVGDHVNQQPVMLASDLVGIPIKALLPAKGTYDRIDGNHIASLMNKTAETGEMFICEVDLGLEEAVDAVSHILQFTHDLKLPFVTLNDIADVTLAKYKAVGEARERVSMGQHLSYQRYWDEHIGPGQQAYKVYDYRGGWRLKPGNYRSSERKWEILQSPDLEKGYQVNRHGFRGAPFRRKKPANQRRIIIVGNSVVFGTAGETVPWPAQVGIRLDELMGVGCCHVVNAGIEGQSSVHSWMRLDRILTFKPDVLVVAVGANDLFLNNPSDYWDTSGLAYATAWEVTGEYPLDFDYIRSIGGFCRNMEPTKFFPFSYADHLMRIVNLCRLAGTEPILTSLPSLIPADMRWARKEHWDLMHHPAFVSEGDIVAMRILYEAYNKASKVVSEREGVFYIDVEEYFTAHFDDQRQNLFTDTCHTNQLGNVLIGRFIAEKLSKRVLK